MEERCRLLFAAGILLLSLSTLGALVDSQPSPPGSGVGDQQLSPIFTVTTSNQVVWKEGDAKNISINISSSKPSSSESILTWCTHLLTSAEHNSSSDVEDSCQAAPTTSKHGTAAQLLDKAASSGNITVEANASEVPPIELQLDWRDIKPTDEYILAARLYGVHNAIVPPQPGIAMFVYGVSPGTCPPGTVNQNGRIQPPLTFHEPNATLQDMFLEVCSSPNACTAVPVSTYQRKLLHPAFSPPQTNYSALVPHSSSSAFLVLRSIRSGDTVLFNASRCPKLKTFYQDISQDDQELRYNITGQLGQTCHLTITVYRGQPAARTDTSSMTAADSSEASHSTPQNFTVTLVQLMDPAQLQLDTLAITNITHTLVLCGNYTPRVLSFPKEAVIQADPFSVSCDEGSCFSVQEGQLPKSGHMLLNGSSNLGAYMSALPASKPFLKGNASYERLSITVKSLDSNVYNLINYRLLVIHNASDPDTDTEKFLCSTRTSASSDVIPFIPPTLDNATCLNQTQIKTWLFSTRNPAYPRHPAQGDSCFVCPSGTHSALAGTDACQYCPPGYYSNLSQWPAPLLSSCKTCRPGTFSAWGARQCRRCWSGTFAPNNASTSCQLCPPGKSTNGDGAAACDLNVTPDIEYDAVLLKFVVELTGTFNLDQLPSVTGINSTGPLILSYLMRRDVASWLNVSTDDVDASLPVAAARHLIKMDVSAKLQDESEAARSSKQLTSDEVVAGLSQGETMRYSGASQVNVRMLSKTDLHRKKRKRMQQLHAILWPVLLGVSALAGTTYWLCRRYLRRRNRKMPLQMHDTTGFLRWLNRDSVGHSSVSGGECMGLDLELPDVAVNSSTSPTPGLQRHRKQFITNYSSDDSP